MFFVLSKILDLFLQPICWIFLLLGVAFIFKAKKVRKYSLITCISCLLIFTNGKFTDLLNNCWETPYTNTHHQTYTVGIVLTGGIIQPAKNNDSTIHFGPHADRLMQAIILFKKGFLRKIMITGGNVSIAGNLLNDSTNESFKAAAYLKLVGIPDSSIIIESKARNTHENAIYSKELLIRLNLQDEKVALITSADHMKRSAACFKKVGISFDMFPAVKIGKDTSSGILNDFIPDERNLYLNASLIREIAGYYIYKLMGYC